jgi:CHAT domain-containing protein
VVPDGALHGLSFASLVRGERYLVESLPLHLVASSTVYAQLRRRGEVRGGDRDWLGFGDPQMPRPDGHSAATADPPSLLERARGLEPLPGARREVSAIASLYGEDAEAHLGREATEGRVLESASRGRIFHFATHGLLDPIVPLDSGIVLSPEDGKDNGLLQAWEILDQLRIDADLVTLSACDTALGTEIAGEGIIGLSRAFQFAGARAVLATLWGVEDESTASLMCRFYAARQAGQSTDQALRTAQRSLIDDQRWSHPYHWAGFVLIGDWR